MTIEEFMDIVGINREDAGCFLNFLSQKRQVIKLDDGSYSIPGELCFWVKDTEEKWIDITINELNKIIGIKHSNTEIAMTIMYFLLYTKAAKKTKNGFKVKPIFKFNYYQLKRVAELKNPQAKYDEIKGKINKAKEEVNNLLQVMEKEEKWGTLDDRACRYVVRTIKRSIEKNKVLIRDIIEGCVMPTAWLFPPNGPRADKTEDYLYALEDKLDVLTSKLVEKLFQCSKEEVQNVIELFNFLEEFCVKV